MCTVEGQQVLKKLLIELFVIFSILLSSPRCSKLGVTGFTLLLWPESQTMSSCVSLVSLPLQKFCDVGFNDVELGRQCQARQLPVVLSEGLDGRDIVTLKDITLCPSKMQLCLCKSHKNSCVFVATVYLHKMYFIWKSNQRCSN